MIEATQVIRKPLLTEKSTQAMSEGAYTFEVDRRATKTQIKRAVEELYDVRVEDVRTTIKKGKMRRLRYGWIVGGDRKKAMVRLAEGQVIELF